MQIHDRPEPELASTDFDFQAALQEHGMPPLKRGKVRSLQVNLTRRCNLACRHCHVESGPKRTETLGLSGVERVLALLAEHPQLEILDLTGGAPELHPHFRALVEGGRALGRRVIDRCNLSVLHEPGQETLASFLAGNDVEIMASLPCYTRENVESQRGRGVFDDSIQALRWLNRLGYGSGSGRERRLRLDLVYNPVGPGLPPDQKLLEERYRSELRQLFDIEFDSLLTITNMPIKRFEHDLKRAGKEHEYRQLLASSFNPGNLDALMCRELLSVDHRGRLFDCDFNLALDLAPPGQERNIWQLRSLAALEGRSIATGSHCFGCTAGSGSSCGGALT